MDVSVPRDDLANAARMAAMVVRSTTQYQVVHLSASADSLTLSASNGTGLDFQATISATVADPGDTTADPDELASMVAKLPMGTVRLQSDGGLLATMPTACGKVKRMTGADPTPPRPTPDGAPGIVMDAATSAAMWRRAKRSACKDRTRTSITAVLWERHGDALRWTTTDGHRLALLHCPADVADAWEPLSIPTDTMKVLALAAEQSRQPVRVWRSDVEVPGGKAPIMRPGAVAECGAVRLAMLAPMEDFPNYRMVIPDDPPELRIAVNVKALADVAKRIVWHPNRALMTIRDGRLSLARLDGTASGHLGVEILAGDAVEVGIDPRYLADALTALCVPRATVTFRAPLGPIIFREYTEDSCDMVLVMPQRL